MDIFKLPKGVLPVLFLVLSLVLAFLLIPLTFSFPVLGLSALFIIISLLAYSAKRKRSGVDFVLLAAIILLSFFLVLRANFFLVFLDIVTILFVGSYFLSLPGGIPSLVSLVFSPFAALSRIVLAKNIFPYKTLPFTPDFFKRMKIGQHFPAIVITIVLLLIVIPLLSYANPYFQKIVSDTVKALDLTWIFKNFAKELPVYALRLLVLSLLMFLLPRGVSEQHAANTVKKESSNTIFRINLLIPKVVLSFVLLVFFFTQLQLYFSSAETLKSLGYTNSQYAREVFAQLSIVAFIFFLLMYADRSRSKFSRYLTMLLVVEGVFLCAIALKSVLDYTGQYGFTSKRLYGYAGVTWIFGLFAAFSYHYIKNEFDNRFVRHVVMLSAFVVLGINLLNFDYIIYHYAKPRVFGIDHLYLSRLSPDSGSYDKQLQTLMDLIANEKDPVKKTTYLTATYRVVNAINYLQKKYKDVPLGSFNLSEYQMYKKVEKVDTVNLHEFLNKQQPQTIVPTAVRKMPTGSVSTVQTTPNISR